ncbi:G-protein coupled receptor 26 [Tachysurus fulvidraco]|uniref:G-protein coupled receptor 26 n=1 Tax=Tachysurus fulvidraco TaxID=1234273 RepID=UPI000F4FB382|nr:G-protein coupled receptor 26 [Tachysurus fulvidraco]
MNLADVLACIAVLAVLAVSLLSNALVLICFACSPEIRKRAAGLFTLNLATCNLLLTVTNMPLTLLALAGHEEPGGNGLCRAAAFLETFLSANAMLTVAALSVDGWMAVVFPLSYRSRMRHRDAMLALTYAWAHSACFAAAAACLSWLGYHSLYASCTMRSASTSSVPFSAFTVAFHALTFLLSLVVLCVAYLKVLRVARFHCKRIDVITMQTLVLLVDIHPSVRQRCLEEQRRRRQRAARKISTFIGTFVLCFTPYVITRLVELWPAVPINQHWGVLCKCLAYSKAACDPFVYSLLRHQYRKACTDIINRILKRRSMNSADEWQRAHGPNTVVQAMELPGTLKECTA